MKDWREEMTSTPLPRAGGVSMLRTAGSWVEVPCGASRGASFSALFEGSASMSKRPRSKRSPPMATSTPLSGTTISKVESSFPVVLQRLKRERLGRNTQRILATNEYKLFYDAALQQKRAVRIPVLRMDSVQLCQLRNILGTGHRNVVGKLFSQQLERRRNNHMTCQISTFPLDQIIFDGYSNCALSDTTPATVPAQPICSRPGKPRSSLGLPSPADPTQSRCRRATEHLYTSSFFVDGSLHLPQGWNSVQFDVFGAGNSSRAIFNDRQRRACRPKTQ